MGAILPIFHFRSRKISRHRHTDTPTDRHRQTDRIFLIQVKETNSANAAAAVVRLPRVSSAGYDDDEYATDVGGGGRVSGESRGVSQDEGGGSGGVQEGCQVQVRSFRG